MALPVKSKNEKSAQYNLMSMMSSNPQHPVTRYLMGLRSKNSIRTQYSKLKNASERFGYENPFHDEWVNFTRDNLLWLIQAMISEELKSNTINGTIASVKGVLKELMIDKKISGDAYTHISSVKVLKTDDVEKGTYVPIQQVRDMFIEAHSPSEARNNMIIAFVYGCGLRRSEVPKIKITDIDTKQEPWKLSVFGKGAKKRKVPIPDAIKPYILEWIESYCIDTSGFLFVQIKRGDNVTDKVLSEKSIYNVVRERAVMNGVSPHDLRRTFISNLIDADVGIETVSKIVGHDSIETTKTYDLTVEKRIDQAASKLPF